MEIWFKSWKSINMCVTPVWAAGVIELLLSPGCQGPAPPVPPSVHHPDWQGKDYFIFNILYIYYIYIIEYLIFRRSSSLCSTTPLWVRRRPTASGCWWATPSTSWTAVATATSASCTASASSARIRLSWSAASTPHRKVLIRLISLGVMMDVIEYI